MNPNLTIEKATGADLPGLELLFSAVHDELESGPNYPGWLRGIYPTAADAEEALAEGTLYVAKRGLTIVGCLVLNHKEEQNYCTVEWLVDVTAEQVYVLHTFMVHPEHKSTGLAQRLMKFAEDQARRDGMRSVRLDVYENNWPAVRLYENCGYRRLARIDLGLQAFNLDYFLIYEKVV